MATNIRKGAIPKDDLTNFLELKNPNVFIYELLQHESKPRFLLLCIEYGLLLYLWSIDTIVSGFILLKAYIVYL